MHPAHSLAAAPTHHLHLASAAVEVIPLSCGIDLLFLADHSAPLISAQAWVRTGSILEADLLGTGVSHLVEHMVFQGAGDRGPGELAHAVQNSGGYLNAYTSFDRTVYWIDTLSTGLDTALHVLGDLTVRARFPEAEFIKEKDVIRREIDMGKDDPGRVMSQLLFSTIYTEHPFREPVIGRLHLFNTVDRDAAYNYYRQRYTADRVFLVVTGDTDAATVKDMAEKHFAGLSVHSPLLLPLADEPPQTSPREAHIEFATAVTKMELAWRIPGLLHEDAPALEVLGVLLGSGRTSRLWREIRERRALAHSTGAGAYLPIQSGIFYASAECEPQHHTALTAAMHTEIQRLQTDGVTAAEVTRARRLFLSEHYHTLTTMRGQASDLGSNWHATRDPHLSSVWHQKINHVTPADVQRVAQRWLIDSTLTHISLNPTGTLTKTRTSRPRTTAAEIQRHVFPSGLTLLVREDPRIPLISLHASLRGGLLAEDTTTNGRGNLLSRVLIKGTTRHNAEAIASLIEDGGGSISGGSGGSSFNLSVECLSPELETALDIWADVLLHPTFPPEEVARESERQAAAIRQQMDHPSFVAFQSLRRALYGTHPLSLTREGTPESLASLDSPALHAFHRQSVTTGNLVLSIFGDVHMSTLIPAIERAFAQLPTGPRLHSHHLPPVPTHTPTTITTPMDKKQAFIVAGFPTVDLTHPDRIALDLIDTACSDMASRFFERIREQHGLAYSVGTTQILAMAPGAFTFYLSTSPEQASFAEAELLSEITTLAATGLTAAELERAKITWTGQQAMQRQSNSGLAQITALDELYGMGYQHSQAVLDSVQRITLAEVAAVCHRYFSPAPIISRAMPVDLPASA